MPLSNCPGDLALQIRSRDDVAVQHDGEEVVDVGARPGLEVLRRLVLESEVDDPRVAAVTLVSSEALILPRSSCAAGELGRERRVYRRPLGRRTSWSPRR